MADIKLTAADGHEFGAYRVDPDSIPRGAIVVVQEIFGVNSHIRSVCDRIAKLGYVAIAPSLFDRKERDFQSGYSAEEVEHARAFLGGADFDAFVRDTDAAKNAVADVGKIGIVGFCLGGTVAYMAGTRLSGISAVSGFYGGRIAMVAHEVPRCATQLHYGSEDHGIPMSNVEAVRAQRSDIDIYLYQGAGHGFNCNERGSFDEAAAGQAWGRMVDFFAEHVG